MGFSWSELKKKSDNEIIREHDAMIASGIVNVGLDYFVAEIYHRRQARIARYILWLTIVITVLTLVNVVVVIAPWIHEW